MAFRPRPTDSPPTSPHPALSEDALIDRERLWVEQRQKRARRQTLLFLIAALSLWLTLYLNRLARERESRTLAQHFTGKWELETLGNRRIGDANAEILAQTITFTENRMNGETRIRAQSSAGTESMPFPDKSTRTVEVSLDGKTVTVKWEGTYEILRGGRVTLHCGASTNTVQARWDAKTQRLVCDHDFMLTYPDSAQYRPPMSGTPAPR